MQEAISDEEDESEDEDFFIKADKRDISESESE